MVQGGPGSPDTGPGGSLFFYSFIYSKNNDTVHYSTYIHEFLFLKAEKRTNQACNSYRCIQGFLTSHFSQAALRDNSGGLPSSDADFAGFFSLSKGFVAITESLSVDLG